MEGRIKRAGGAALAAAALLAAPAAAQAAGVSVSQISSLRAGAKAGTLRGTVVNETNRATRTNVVVRVMRNGARAPVVGRAAVNVGARGTAAFVVSVKLPSSLKRGNYYLSACTPYGGGDAGKLGCATAAKDIAIKGGLPLRGPVAERQYQAGLSAKADADCSSGAHTLAIPGQRVWPELGNGGYQSIHTDVFTVYDAVNNVFLPGNHVELTQRSTQCLTDFSLDFDAHSKTGGNNPPLGSDMRVDSVTIDGQPATFKSVQPTYPGDPNGQDDPDPLAHMANNLIPDAATGLKPPACASVNNQASQQNVPCSPTKLVVTPAQPIPAGITFKVVVNYTGRPGARANPSLTNEGWFRNNNPMGDGAMVTSEPSGTMAWMPLNNHPTVKPTYDLHSTVNYEPGATKPEDNRVFIANGRLVSTVVNPPDANYPVGGSRTFHWHSAEPIASYLVENSVGHFELSERPATAGDVLYYEAQSVNIAPDRKVSNKAIMDMQEQITHFQELVNGPFPFDANGIIVALPQASFEEEMQTKIVFVGGSIGATAEIFSHENMHQWWGDAVSYSEPRYTFFKEGYADFSQYLFLAREAGLAAGPEGSAAYDAAFEAAIVSRFNARYLNVTPNFWSVAPDNPTSGQLFSSANTYNRPGQSYAALRAILGKANFAVASQEIQRDFKFGSISPSQQIAIYHKYMPNKSIGCSRKLDAFFKQWWDTSYTGVAANGNRPQITGPGLAGGGFYDANGGCSDYGVDVPAQPGASVPATLSLTLGAPATFGTFTPGVARDYTASTTANVISTAGDGLLSVADPSANAPGHLVNGTFSLPSALKVAATSPAGTSAGMGSASGSPLSLLTWSGPVSNDAVALAYTQTIGATDALRTGTYSKTLTFTLSTTTP